MPSNLGTIAKAYATPVNINEYNPGELPTILDLYVLTYDKDSKLNTASSLIKNNLSTYLQNCVYQKKKKKGERSTCWEPTGWYKWIILSLTIQFYVLKFRRKVNDIMSFCTSYFLCITIF